MIIENGSTFWSLWLWKQGFSSGAVKIYPPSKSKQSTGISLSGRVILFSKRDERILGICVFAASILFQKQWSEKLCNRFLVSLVLNIVIPSNMWTNLETDFFCCKIQLKESIKWTLASERNILTQFLYCAYLRHQTATRRGSPRRGVSSGPAQTVPPMRYVPAWPDHPPGSPLRVFGAVYPVRFRPPWSLISTERNSQFFH